MKSIKNMSALQKWHAHYRLQICLYICGEKGLDQAEGVFREEYLLVINHLFFALKIIQKLIKKYNTNVFLKSSCRIVVRAFDSVCNNLHGLGLKSYLKKANINNLTNIIFFHFHDKQKNKLLLFFSSQLEFQFNGIGSAVNRALDGSTYPG